MKKYFKNHQSNHCTPLSNLKTGKNACLIKLKQVSHHFLQQEKLCTFVN